MSVSTDANADVSLTDATSGLAKGLAPEEVRVGDFVAVLHEVYEFPSFFWDCDSQLSSREEIVRMLFTPDFAGEPLEVRAVCLPFVMVKPMKGKPWQVDVRRKRLARLDAQYIAAWQTAWKKRKK